ncbi:MAG: PEP-CTERM sorting domain-containing protein [Verrucomicrobiota bacterium]
MRSLILALLCCVSTAPLSASVINLVEDFNSYGDGTNGGRILAGDPTSFFEGNWNIGPFGATGGFVDYFRAPFTGDGFVAVGTVSALTYAEPFAPGKYNVTVETFASGSESRSISVFFGSATPTYTYALGDSTDNQFNQFSVTLSGETNLSLVNIGFGRTLNVTSINVTQVPEPTTYAIIFGIAALAFVTLRRRIRN